MTAIDAEDEICWLAATDDGAALGADEMPPAVRPAGDDRRHGGGRRPMAVAALDQLTAAAQAGDADAA